jgi:CRP-like cAMP-binding protein
MPEEIADKIHKTLSQYPKRTYPKGQIIVFADESPSHIFYIVKGKVIKYDVSYRGDEVIVNVFKPPAFFPLSWAINRSKNSYFYKTDDETELHVVPGNDAVKFLKDNPDVMYDLISRIYRGMDGMLARMVQLMSGTAKSRMLYELLIEARRFGEKQKGGSCKLKISEVDLAGRAGLSRETVSREMQGLKDSGLVAITSPFIIITSIEAVERVLGKEV